jgi:DNA replication protein DnaC
MDMQHQALLENYLRQLHLSTFLQNYQIYAQDTARTDLSYERYLLALCGAEVTQRDAMRVERAILAAKFPVLKDLASFDFEAVQNISKQRVLELAQGAYMASAETIILIGNPGLGKTPIATGLA